MLKLFLIQAMNAGLKALQQNNTWIFVSLTNGHKPISNKWVYKIKYKFDGISINVTSPVLLLKDTIKMKALIIENLFHL